MADLSPDAWRRLLGPKPEPKDDYYPARGADLPLPEPTDVPPGDPGREPVLSLRVDQGEQLFHPYDEDGKDTHKLQRLAIRVDVERNGRVGNNRWLVREEHARALYWLSKLYDSVKKDTQKAQECVERLKSKDFEGAEYAKKIAAEK